MSSEKIKNLKGLGKEEKEKKLKELKMELIKTKATGLKKGSKKAKEIRKMISRILTLNK